MMILRAGLPGFLQLFVALGVMFSGSGASPNLTVDRITLYLAQPGSPVAIQNFVNPGAGCDWWGVGGQMFNEAGRPEPGLVVRVRGVIDGVAIDQTKPSNSSQSFGPGGFDIQLADHLPTTAALNLQVFDTAGRPQSGVIPLAIFRTCSQNLLIINLRQRSYARFSYLPWVRR